MAGWLDSYALTYRMAQSAANATILLDVQEVRIRVEGGRVTGVETANGFIAAPRVVIAAGANARQVAATTGVELPLEVRPRQSFTTGWRHEGFAPDSPCVISAAPFPHVRPEAQTGAIFGWEYNWNNKHHKVANAPTRNALRDPIWPAAKLRDPRFPSLVLTLLARQFGYRDGEGFADPRYLREIDHRAGYYVYRNGNNAYTTDARGNRHPYESQRAIIDATPGVDGLFLSVAHVGHGIMSAPAAGEVVAAHVLGRPLPDPAYADFQLDVPWVEHDSGGLASVESLDTST
jgi:glycine/D-amino acid oxidase-like deaminating enzyme